MACHGKYPGTPLVRGALPAAPARRQYCIVASETVIIAGAVCCVGLLSVIVRLIRHLAVQQHVALTDEWLDRLSIRTDELLRLVNEDPKPACLPRLKEDFDSVCQGVKAIMVESDRDRPDLARALVRSQLTFAYRMTAVQFPIARARLWPSTTRRPRV